MTIDVNDGPYDVVVEQTVNQVVVDEVTNSVVVEQVTNEVTVVAPGAAGALGYYGSFFSDQDQNASVVNTPTLMTLNNTAEANGVSITSGSRVTFAYDGTYDLQFSAQLHHRGGGGNGTEIDIWLVKNGTPVPDTATKLIIPKNSYEVAAWDFLLTLAAGDYLELAYRTTNTDIYIEHAVADGVPVDTPSLIVTVMQVMYNQVGPVGPQGPTGATGAKGDKGDKGDTGDAATIAVGTTSTLAPGASATVTNSGTSSAAVFDFGIPEGDKGDKGDTGDTGATGPQGPSGVISVTAPITNTGTSTSALLGLTTGTGLTTAGGTLAADIGTSSSTVASGDRGLPTGGGTGQMLVKQSGSNYDTQWVTPTTDAPVSASYVTLGTDGTLTSERVLTAGTGISVTDAGAGSTVTVATSAILPTVVDAKGDLLAGTAADTVARLPVGADDTVLMAASGETAGLVWRSPRLAGGAARPLLTGGAYLDGTTGLVLSGLLGNFARTPDSAALDVTGDIELVARVSLNNWTLASPQNIIGKRQAGQQSYWWTFNGGQAAIAWTTDGSTVNGIFSSATVSFSANATKWLKVTLDVDNGTGGRTATFYTADDSPTEPSSWTQLGTPVTQSGVTSIFNSNANLEIGAASSAGILNGTIRRAIVRNGIGGATVFDANFETQTADALAFTASSNSGIKADGLVLQGRAGEYASSPDSAALSITGDIDIKVKATLTDWTPAVAAALAAKYGAGGARSFLFWVQTDGTLRLTTSSDGTAVIAMNSTVVNGIADGATKWVRATLDVNDGASNRVAKFYTSDDGSTWTQLGTTVTTAGTTSIFDGTAPLEIGSIVTGTQQLAVGTIHEVIIQSAFDTANNTSNLAFDADFDAQPAGTLSFNESSSNAALVTVIGCDPTVTINTTRYFVGYPNIVFTATSTGALVANTDYYAPFLITSPIVVDMMQFEVTTGPASNATVFMGVYAANADFQPTGSPLIDTSQAVTVSATGVFYKQITPVTLQPGAYVSVLNSSVVQTLRRTQSGSWTQALHTMGANIFPNLLFASRTAAALPSSPSGWNTRNGSTGTLLYYPQLRWRAV